MRDSTRKCLLYSLTGGAFTFIGSKGIVLLLIGGLMMLLIGFAYLIASLRHWIVGNYIDYFLDQHGDIRQQANLRYPAVGNGLQVTGIILRLKDGGWRKSNRFICFDVEHPRGFVQVKTNWKIRNVDFQKETLTLEGSDGFDVRDLIANAVRLINGEMRYGVRTLIHTLRISNTSTTNQRDTLGITFSLILLILQEKRQTAGRSEHARAIREDLEIALQDMPQELLEQWTAAASERLRAREDIEAAEAAGM